MNAVDASALQAPPVTAADVPPVLAVEQLSVELRLRNRTVYPLSRVSIAVRHGETLGIVGESGSGKSMLALAVMRLLPAPFGHISSGAVRIRDRNLVELPEAAMRKVRGAWISMVFQEPMTALDPLFKVGDQIAETLRTHKKISWEEARAAALALLRRVDIPSPERRLDSYPFELSGGMRQRIVIAIGLALRPDILIADEPTTALDVTVQSQILALLRELQAEFGMGTILITHDLGVVAEIAERVAVMYGGMVVEEASADALFDRPMHPYTNGLIRSKLGGADARGRLYVIPGAPPTLTAPPVGCPFAPRCERAESRCSVEMPPRLATSDDASHTFACWNPVS